MIDVLACRQLAASAVAGYRPRLSSKSDQDQATSTPSRGIVTSGGGPVYFVQAFVMATLLRRLGCTLPIECWHWGEAEMTPRMRALLKDLDVVPCDAMTIAKREHISHVVPWVIKPMAVLHSAFDQVLFLDSDCVPIRDPTYLYDDESFKRYGCLFWTDRYRGTGSAFPTVRSAAWALTNVPYRDEPECESGQFLCDRRRCERELFLTYHFNQQSDFYYQTLYGDKDTFRLAWHRLGRQFNTVPFGPSSPAGYRVLYHFDPSGQLIFQHRARSKWSLHGDNPELPGFHHHSECIAILNELKAHWERIRCELVESVSPAITTAHEQILAEPRRWCRIGGRRWQPILFHDDGSLEIHSNLVPTHWHVMEQPSGDVSLNLVGDRAAPITLYRDGDSWTGQRLAGTRPAITITKVRTETDEMASSARNTTEGNDGVADAYPKDPEAFTTEVAGSESYEVAHPDSDAGTIMAFGAPYLTKTSNELFESASSIPQAYSAESEFRQGIPYPMSRPRTGLGHEFEIPMRDVASLSQRRPHIEPVGPYQRATLANVYQANQRQTVNHTNDRPGQYAYREPAPEPIQLSPDRHARIKIHGLPRTCTNLLTVQLERHFDATVYANDLGWKHGPNLFRQGDVLHREPMQFIVCVKHPYSWLVSFFKFDQSAHSYKTSFRDFVLGQCRTYGGHNPIDRYNFLNRMWLAATTDAQFGQTVHSERMQSNQVETLALLESRLRIRRTRPSLHAETRRIGPDEQIRRRAFDPSPYRSQDFLRLFDANLLREVNERLDSDVVTKLGYRLSDRPFPFALLAND
ncbi:MAG: hypothetical protein AAGJ40_13030 [Planctomycetota bacterium]